MLLDGWLAEKSFVLGCTVLCSAVYRQRQSEGIVFTSVHPPHPPIPLSRSVMINSTFFCVFRALRSAQRRKREKSPKGFESSSSFSLIHNRLFTLPRAGSRTDLTGQTKFLLIIPNSSRASRNRKILIHKYKLSFMLSLSCRTQPENGFLLS